MKILLTGANGYIGKRLLPNLLQEDNRVTCMVRDKSRFSPHPSFAEKINVIEGDLLKKESLSKIPIDIDIAYYLVHSMSSSSDYAEMEKESARNFREIIERTNAKQIIYLSGIVNEDTLSEHLSSRFNVERELGKGKYGLTTLRAGIIIGSGSASFEIIRDLVEKLPLMITPKWLNTKCQPIGVGDVIKYLLSVKGCEQCLGKSYDIGGKDILTYKEMLLKFAEKRGLNRTIITLPVMTPKLSSYWLYFVTSTSYKLASALVDSMKVEVVCQQNDLNNILNIEVKSYDQALDKAFSKIENHDIVSTWKDSQISGVSNFKTSDFISVPTHGCFKDKRITKIINQEETIDRIWKIGGKTGWYYGNFLWKLRGFMDKMVGGVGLRRGRSSEDHIEVGDAIDFWRVLYADKNEGRLLLFAEMKLPGEAWLEFKILNGELIQEATFRPIGLMGRLYWYSVYVFHGFIFQGMSNKIVKG
jgi:uncharacterized protein YbjT (DUF2867 family)